MMEAKLYLKHAMSCLPDFWATACVDSERRLVTMAMDRFDSALFATMVTRKLVDELGIVAYRDDTRKDALWLTHPSPYGLVVRLNSASYEAEVVKLIDGVTVAVSLEPLPRCKERSNS